MRLRRVALPLLLFVGVAVIHGLILYQGPTVPSAVSPWLGLGFIVVTAHLAGLICREFSLPALTGYLITGILFGPSVFGFLTGPDIQSLELINTVALSFIAITAGGELRLTSLRKQAATIGAMTFFIMLFVGGGIALVMFPAVHSLFPNMFGDTRTEWMAALVLAVIAMAKSPASTIAIISEYRARGPFTDVVLGVTMVKDVVVLVVFALVMAVLRGMTVGGPISFGDMGHILAEIGISLVAGVVYGGLMILFYRFVGREISVFIVLASFVAYELAQVAGLEHMLMCMVAGFVVQNFSRQGALMIEGIEKSHLPIYVIFFAIAGAGLDFSTFGTVAWLVLIFVVLRMALIIAATWTAGRLTGATDSVRRWAWTGLLTNAGLSLSIVILVEQSFPDWGGVVRAVVIAVIAVNQIIGPVLFKIGLFRSGEAREPGR